MKDIFPINRNPYNLKQNSQFSRPRINTLFYGTESILGQKYEIWYQLKQISDLHKLKKTH